MVPATLLLIGFAGGCNSPAQPSEHVHDHHLTEAAGPAAPTAVPTTAELSSTCEVPAPTSGDAQLESVELVVAGDQLVLAFTLAAPVTGDLTVKVVAAPDAGSGAQDGGFGITAALRDAEPVAVALQTPTSTTAAPRPGDLVHVVDNQVHIGVPRTLVDQLGPRWHWSASTASGARHATCPVAPGTIPVTVAVP